MAKSLPLKTADNDYGIMFWGPPGPEEQDDGSELTINTASNHSIRFAESGNSVSVTPKCHTEIVGQSLKPNTQDGKNAPAKQILANNGDIVISAKNGDIFLDARNIFIHASGDENNGGIVISGNGNVNIVAGDQARFVASKVCIRGEVDVDIFGPAISILGDIKAASEQSVIGNLKSLVSGDFVSLLEGITKSCK